MRKYEPLGRHLRSRTEERVVLTFQAVQEILDAPLPPSARKYREWWNNEPSGRPHPQSTDGWLTAGWQVDEVDLASKRVTFRRRQGTESLTPRRSPG